jgi:hypothetical protein
VSRSLLEVLRTVTLDPGEQAAFTADRAGYLAQYGYEDVPDDALAEAFSLVADTLPADVAQTVAPGGADSFGSFGSTETDLADDDGSVALSGDGLVAGPTVDADLDQTSFGAVNHDFDDDAGTVVADELDAAEAAAGGENGSVGFGEGSEADSLGDGDYGDLADGSAPIGDTVDLSDHDGAEVADELGDVDDGLVLNEVDDVDQDADFGTGDADDGNFDLDDSLDDSLDLTDPGGDIDDIGAF